MNLDVRPIGRDEVAIAVALVVAGSLSPEGERPDDLEAYWTGVIATRAGGGDVLVAVDGAEVVGVCQVLVLPHFQHAGGRCCELESVYVRDDRRSRGVGAAMLGAAETLARDSGCYRMQLTSRNQRLDAHRFYRANGFAQTSQGFKKTLEA